MARPHGTKYIETPEIFWEWFEEYKKQTKATPIKKMVFVGKDGSKDWEERERPLTVEGFRNFCRRKGCEVRQYFDNDGDRYNDYISICRAVKDEIRQDQIDGGMVMIYNPSITQRLNGLVEKTETKGDVKLSVSADFNQIIQPTQGTGEDTPLGK